MTPDNRMKPFADYLRGVLFTVFLLSLCAAAPVFAGGGVNGPQLMVFTAEEAQALELPAFLPGPYWTPPPEVVRAAEQALTYYVNLYSPRGYTMLKGDLSEYKRQYIGYTLHGHQVVYINAFCEDIAHWRQEFVWVYGGGECFFQVNYDPTAEMFFMFVINGA